ncbi:hypothetical protein KEM55_008699, partial [Ascosphaera atra]
MGEEYEENGSKLMKGIRGFGRSLHYTFFTRPNLPFMKYQRPAPFFPLHERMPVLLALILGLQHSLAMLAGVITVPIMISGQANLDNDTQQYLVSTVLIVSGILSCVQITRIWIYKTPYYIGTGVLSIVGSSFAFITTAEGSLAQMYENGYCPKDSSGNKLACPQGYGALIGTACLCGLLEVGLSFTSAKALKKLFPPIVTGPVVLLIGVHLIETGLQDWAGGSSDCSSRPSEGMYRLCPEVGAPHAAPWGSAQFIGLGFLVFLTIIVCER